MDFTKNCFKIKLPNVEHSVHCLIEMTFQKYFELSQHLENFKSLQRLL